MVAGDIARNKNQQNQDNHQDISCFSHTAIYEKSTENITGSEKKVWIFVLLDS